MRILHLIASVNLADGGAIEGAVRMGEMLAARGHRQDIMSLDDPRDPFIAAVPATVFALGDRSARGRGPLGRLRQRLAITPAATPWLRDHVDAYDVAIVAGLWNYSTLVARRVLVGGALPYVVFTHGMLDPWFKRRYPLKAAVKQMLWFVNEGPLLRNADRVLFTCEEERLLARRSYRPYAAREEVIGFGTMDVPLARAEQQIAAFRASLPALGRRPYLLFLGRIHEKKGCDLLVEAFARHAALAPDLALVIAGPDQQGLAATLQQRAHTLGIGDRLLWPGMIAGDIKWGALHGCEALVLPSHQENFGVVLAEAMACSRPILTTDKVNIWRELEASGGSIVTADTLAGVSEGLARFLRLGSAERRAMGARGRQCFESSYRMDSFVDRLERTLADVATHSTRRRAAPPPGASR